MSKGRNGSYCIDPKDKENNRCLLDAWRWKGKLRLRDVHDFFSIRQYSWSVSALGPGWDSDHHRASQSPLWWVQGHGETSTPIAGIRDCSVL